jgi:hypothetical protein
MRLTAATAITTRSIVCIPRRSHIDTKFGSRVVKEAGSFEGVDARRDAFLQRIHTAL